MSKIVLYPADGYDFDAADVAAYLAGLTSGVFSSAEDFPVTAADGLKVTVGAGRGWVHPSRFTGYSITKREADTLTLPLADPSLPRIDRIVMRYDAGARAASLQVLQGTASSTPTAPAISRTELIYDLCLAEIKRPAGSTAVTAADIYDTRADETVCGVMRDGVHGIPAATLIQMLRQKIAEMDSGSFYTKEAVDDMLAVIQAQVAKAGAPTERLAFVTQISANAWGWNQTMSCEATIPKGMDFIRITPENFDSPYVFQFSTNKDLSLTGGNSKAVSVICASNANFKYTASDRKIKITAYNTSIGSTCIQGYKYGTAATPCIVWTEGDGTSAKDHDIDYIEIKERYNADSSDDKNTVEAVARVVKGSTYKTAGGATVTFASDGTATAKDCSGTLVGYRYMTLTEVSEQLASTQSALADADALNLDQDYRLTLLELGVTDDETTA